MNAPNVHLRGYPASRRAEVIVLIAGLCVVLGAGACSPDRGADRVRAEGSPSTIAQPVVPGDLPVAPTSARVDTVMPRFSDPTNITNPLFPVSREGSTLLLGRVDGKAFRTEVTLLPDTRIIEWNGQQVETLVSQYVAYLGGRIHEVAYDFYAQADDGSVWYFGEDVFNFDRGAIADTHGTWIAGKDGPAAMIMPGDPKVGDIYRPENIPGFVFEEVTIRSVGRTLHGPLGPVEGGLVVEELHMDGTTEDKVFAPGYGEFSTAGGGDVEALALGIATDARSGPMPAELSTLANGSIAVFDAAGSANWATASAAVDRLLGAWDALAKTDVPRMIEPRMNATLGALGRAVDARDAERARQAAIDAARWSLDLELLYRPPVEVDIARFDLWAAQLVVDARAGDVAAVKGDLFALDYVRDRIMHVLDGAHVTRINTTLEALQGAVGDADLTRAARIAVDLRDVVARISTG